MGYFAGAIDANDANPAEDFHRPPAPQTAHDGTIAGFVTDSQTGDPVANAVVTIGGFGDQFTALTGADGFYEFDGLYIGTYQKVAASAPGFFGDASPERRCASVTSPEGTSPTWSSSATGRPRPVTPW